MERKDLPRSYPKPIVRTTTILEQDKQFSLTLLAEGTGCCTYDLVLKAREDVSRECEA